MSVTLEFIGGPWDGQTMAHPAGTDSIRVAFAPSLNMFAAPDEAFPVRIREGLYVRDFFRREQSFRGGVQNNLRRYIVDRDVMRWTGET